MVADLDLDVEPAKGTRAFGGRVSVSATDWMWETGVMPINTRSESPPVHSKQSRARRTCDGWTSRRSASMRVRPGAVGAYGI